MKTLILLTNFFPYGTEEPYLETEVNFYKKHFEKVIICSLQLRSWHLQEVRRSLPSPEIVVLPIKKLSFWGYFLWSALVLFDKNFYLELYKLLKDNRFSFSRLKRLVFFLSRSYYESYKIWRELKNDKELISSSLMIYSYRFEYQPYVGLLLKRKLKHARVVARGHRFDLFENLRVEKYIPLRAYLLDRLDMSFMVANQGRNYLLREYPAFSNKVEVARLGTIDQGLGVRPILSNTIRIVSVSTLSNVKRVHLIVEALAQVRHCKICWDHFGDGALRDEILELAQNVLNDNIEYTFHGHISNSSLLQQYTNIPYHYFVNVSSSEGLPVSIMEAMSFGIPCIATNAGGTGELVKNERNGYLLNIDFDPRELADILENTAKGEKSKYFELRENARLDWEKGYNSLNNYERFMERIKSFL